VFLQSVSWYWIAAPLVVAGLGVLILLRGVGHVFGGRGGKATAHMAVGAPLSVIGFAIGLLALNTQTFARLSHENDVPNTVQTCDIQGDTWEMSARVQKWKPWANVLGLDTTYTLDQVTNRYFNAGRANGRPITACDLKGPPPPVDQYVPNSWLNWLVGESYTEQRHFGSAAYMPNADGAVYKLVMTQSGLNAEPLNAAANQANAARP
jgi:hypothetical protein